MRKSWFIAVLGAALLAVAPASALAHTHRHHHAKRHHRARTHLRHFTAASSSAGTTGSTTGTGSTTTPPSDNAGTVTSFDGSTLVITLNDGSTVSGAVTSNTELQCEAAQSSSSTGSQSAPDTVQSDFSRDGGGDQSGSSESDQSSGQPGSSTETDQGDQGDQDDQGEDAAPAACSSANLTPGTVVHEAELAVSSGGSVWRQVDLVLS